MLHRCISIRMAPAKVNCWNWPMLIFWTAMYGYCLIALFGLGIPAQAPWFLGAGLIFTGATLYVSVAKA